MSKQQCMAAPARPNAEFALEGALSSGKNGPMLRTATGTEVVAAWRRQGGSLVLPHTAAAFTPAHLGHCRPECRDTLHGCW